MEQTRGKKYKLTRTPSLLGTFAPQSLCSILVDTSLWMSWNGCRDKKNSITWMEQTHGQKYKHTRTPSLLSTFAPQSLCSILVDTSLWMTWNGCRAIRKKTSDKHIIRYGLDIFNWITRWLTDWHQHCMRRCDQTQYITTQNTNIESEFKQRTNMTTPTQRSQPAIQ